MSKTTIYLMRHGHVHNPQNILYGRLPGFSLSEMGIGQAQAAGEWLADKPISAIYSSPMEARGTNRRHRGRIARNSFTNRRRAHNRSVDAA